MTLNHGVSADDTTRTASMPDLTSAEAIESLAKAIHEGDWMMVAPEWRWCEASRTERATSYQRAAAVKDAYTSGARTAEEFATVIAAIDWTTRTGSAGRLRAKSKKVVQWFDFFEKGILL